MFKKVEDSRQILRVFYETIYHAAQVKDEVLLMFGSCENRKKILIAINDIDGLLGENFWGPKIKNPGHILILQEVKDFLTSVAYGTDLMEGDAYFKNSGEGKSPQLSELEIADIGDISASIGEMFLSEPADVIFKYMNDAIRIVEIFEEGYTGDVISKLKKEQNHFFANKILQDLDGLVAAKQDEVAELEPGFALDTGESFGVPVLVANTEEKLQHAQ